MINYDKVAARLKMLGFEPSTEDKAMIEWEIELILAYVVNYCNFNDESDIPTILDNRIIDRICAEFLFKKKNAGQLEGFDYGSVIKTIKEGDTQIQYGTENDGKTVESRFDDFIDYLYKGFDKWLSLHRRIKW